MKSVLIAPNTYAVVFTEEEDKKLCAPKEPMGFQTDGKAGRLTGREAGCSLDDPSFINYHDGEGIFQRGTSENRRS